MEAADSVRIIEQMIKESRKSLSSGSFYFLLWASLLVPASLVEWYFHDESWRWIVWPIMGGIGGVISMIYSLRVSKEATTVTSAGRIYSYTWGAFGLSALFAVFYAVHIGYMPHALILMAAGGATLISGGISRFKPFVFGGLVLFVGAVVCGFYSNNEMQSLVFAAAIFLGYFIPGILLRKEEKNG